MEVSLGVPFNFLELLLVKCKLEGERTRYLMLLIYGFDDWPVVHKGRASFWPPNGWMLVFPQVHICSDGISFHRLCILTFWLIY